MRQWDEMRIYWILYDVRGTWRCVKNYLHCILTVWQHDSIIIICFNADTTHQTWYADQEDRNKFQRGFLYDLKARLGKIR